MNRIIKGIFDFLHTSLPLLLISSLLLGTATAFWLAGSNNQLEIDDIAPKKIVSLELAKDVATADKVVKAWEANHVTDVALTSIRQDFAFILTYVVAILFFVMLFNRGAGVSIWTKLFSILTIIAGISDVVENAFSMLFILGRTHSNILIYYPAVIKFGCIIITIAYIIGWMLFYAGKFLFYILPNEERRHKALGQVNLAPIGHILKSAKTYLPGLITVIISYFLFIQLTVGQDVVIQISEFGGPFIASLFCIPLWSVFSWYSSRLVGYELQQAGTTIPSPFHTHVPRLIAYNALVSIQAAMLAIPTVGNVNEGGVWAFIIVQNLLYFFWHQILTCDPVPIGYRAVSSIITVAYISAIIYLVTIGEYTHQKMLPLAALFLFFFQMWLSRRFVRRRKSIKENTVEAKLKRGAKLNSEIVMPYIGLKETSKWIRVPEDVRDEELSVFRIVFGFACAALLVFILANAWPLLADRMGALPVTLLAFGIVVVVSNIITIVSIHKGVNVFVVILIWVFIVGKFYDPYQVRTVKPESTTKVLRPDFNTWFKSWVDKRRCAIDSSSSYPVYLVIADGGASRSGYWVSTVLSSLEAKSDPGRDGNSFSDHLMVLAGASGGSVGNATFYALMRSDSSCNSAGDNYYLDRSKAFLRQDFLAPILTHWFGADILNHIFPFYFDDRSTALEKSMEYHGKEPLNNIFAGKFSDVMDTSGRLPILFINTTNVQEGTPAVISTIDIHSFSKRIDVLTHASKIDSPAVTDIRYSTAVVMGARFPYVSPAGNLGKRSFVDGGYFDNTGAGILHEMLQHLKQQQDKGALNIDASTFNKLRFQLIYLRNSSLRTKDLKPMHPLLNDAAAPIVTVLGTYGSQTDVNNSRLKGFMEEFSPGVESIDINLYLEKDEEEFPMNWVISEYNINRMDDNLARQMEKVRLLPIDHSPSTKTCNCHNP